VTARGTAIVGVDGSERSRDALSLAVALCAPGARLLIAHVHPYGQLSSLLGDGEYERLVRETTESIFDDVREVVPDTIERELRLVADDSPARGLEEMALQEGAEIVVVGSSSRSRLSRVLMGSVAEALLSGAPVPVALAPNGFASRSGTSWDVVGCGFDASAESRAALGFAERFAAGHGADLQVIAIHQPLSIGVSSGGPFRFESVNSSVREALGKDLEEATSALTEPVHARASLLDGDPAGALIDQSTQLDLLVVGSRGYGPVKSVVLGSVSRALARGAACPTIVVPRPDDAA
jgi:nucleotide-binding universal stress UspA family protein